MGETETGVRQKWGGRHLRPRTGVTYLSPLGGSARGVAVVGVGLGWVVSGVVSDVGIELGVALAVELGMTGGHAEGCDGCWGLVEGDPSQTPCAPKITLSLPSSPGQGREKRMCIPVLGWGGI